MILDLIYDNIFNCRTHAHPLLIENYMQFSEHNHETNRAKFHTYTKQTSNKEYKIEEFFESTSPVEKRQTFNSEFSTFEESAPITNNYLGMCMLQASSGRRGAIGSMADRPSEMINLI